MRILVQNPATKSFVDFDGRWTHDVRKARDFPTSLNAIVHCLGNQLGDVEVVIRIRGERDTVIPVKEKGRRSTELLRAHSDEI